ncbi:MgtC/SapB family protein [Sphingobium aromaticiconvertens]|uniref:MgtC/SapB family protein n=1 Tax=Sphingobium aromaticiconvertens TaxID=365341 RepID=UPI0030198454
MIDDDWVTIALRLGLATVVGLVIGFEREWRGHDAGIRTHALVALSSAMIVISALLIAREMAQQGQQSDPVRAIQGLAQAIGFIAGGLIFVRGGDVRNMTTAASLWMAAAVGIAAGAGQFTLVLLASTITLLVLTLLSLTKRLIPSPPPDAEIDSDRIRPPNRRGMIDPD